MEADTNIMEQIQWFEEQLKIQLLLKSVKTRRLNILLLALRDVLKRLDQNQEKNNDAKCTRNLSTLSILNGNIDLWL